MKKTHLLNIALVIISMVTIFLFSSENASSSKDTSKKVVKEVVSMVIKDDSKVEKVEKKIDDNLIIVRKCAHIAEYFILGFLLINLIKDYKKLSWKFIILGIILCLLYACTDEFHQIYISGRTPKILDVGIDTFGAFLGTITYYLIYRKYENKIDNKKELA